MEIGDVFYIAKYVKPLFCSTCSELCKMGGV